MTTVKGAPGRGKVVKRCIGCQWTGYVDARTHRCPGCKGGRILGRDRMVKVQA